jgi:hypothetical protein
MTSAPEQIWAFWTPDDFDDDATITAYEKIQHGAQRYVRADRIEALETLLTEIRDLNVERRDHATMDEAEAVMRWTLWEAVLEDIKKMMGG